MKGLRAVLLGAVILMALAASAAAAPAGYDLSWWTIDGGGSSSVGDGYALSATFGQPDAGLAAGGRYVLAGGFWTAAPVPLRRSFLPLIMKTP